MLKARSTEAHTDAADSAYKVIYAEALRGILAKCDDKTLSHEEFVAQVRYAVSHALAWSPPV